MKKKNIMEKGKSIQTEISKRAVEDGEAVSAISGEEGYAGILSANI